MTKQLSGECYKINIFCSFIKDKLLSYSVSACFFFYTVLFHQVVRAFIVIHSTSDPLVECFFTVVLSTYSLFLPEKAENDFGGNRTPDFLL